MFCLALLTGNQRTNNTTSAVTIMDDEKFDFGNRSLEHNTIEKQDYGFR